MQDKIEAIRKAGFGIKFAEEVLAKAQAKADNSNENVYICYDIDCIYYVYHSFLNMSDVVITHLEPANPLV